MVWPRVSILWVNYNSMKMLNIIKKSLEGVAGLDYPSYEVVIVDNGSTDGSYQEIKRIAKRLPVDKKIVRLERNLGFTGGNNVAYRARDPDSKYIALLNNDAIPFQDSLRRLVEYAESVEGSGAVQGLLIDPRTGLVDTAGEILTELLIAYQLYHGRNASDIGNAFYVTYADGAYSVYKIGAVRKATGYNDKIFDDEMFAYFDDSILGLQLWNAGFKVISCPILAGYHRRSSTFIQVKPLQLYLMSRGYIALNEICNSRYKALIKGSMLRRALLQSITPFIASRLFGRRYKVSISARELFRLLYKAHRDGIKLGRRMLKERGALIDLYKAPLKGPKGHTIFGLFTGLGVDYLRRIYTMRITRAFERELHNYICTVRAT